MSMFTDMANVSASGRINKHSFLLAAAGYICVNIEIRGAGSELSKHRRHRGECLFIRHQYYYRSAAASHVSRVFGAKLSNNEDSNTTTNTHNNTNDNNATNNGTTTTTTTATTTTTTNDDAHANATSTTHNLNTLSPSL